MPDIVYRIEDGKRIAQERSERERDLVAACIDGTAHEALVQAYLRFVGMCEPENFQISLNNYIAGENFYATAGPHRTLAEITEDGTYGHVKDLERYDNR